MKLKYISGAIFCAVALNCYAINISVQSSSKDVSALGFTVNGKNHGGMGSSYSKKNMPNGNYSFGVRVGGLMGTDVPCKIKGKATVSLNRNTTAVLNYDGNKCTAKTYLK